MDRTVYDQLRAMARQRLASQPLGHSLQATGLANEAWMRLQRHFNPDDNSPAFFCTAVEAMRQILIDHARAKQRLKRGGPVKREREAVEEIAADKVPDEWIELDEALGRLEELDPQAAQIVKLRFFAGLSVEETAAALDISERTVKRDWQFARTWLFGQLSNEEAPKVLAE
jgi:RNA polymerase sigma-70 factor, ECF subfamily